MSQQVEQTTPDQFLKNVQIFTHMILRRENPLFSYDHHLLVLGFDNVAINVTEYGLQSGFINIIGAALDNYLGEVHYKTITFNELYHRGASKVFFQYNEYHPNSTEQINQLMERLRYREGETSYSFIYNNCEHYVNFLLTGNPISTQWRDASTAIRFLGDFVQNIPGLVINGGAKLVLQKCLTKVQSKQVSVECAPFEENEKERFINAPPAQNTLGSKLRGIFKRLISSIPERDLLFATICLLLKINYLQGGHSPGKYIWEIIKIVGLETFLLLFRKHRQLWEIAKKLHLCLHNVISTVDSLREIVKISVLYLVCMTKVAGISSESDSTFRELFRRCLVTMFLSSFAGLLFDISTMCRLLRIV